MNSFDVVRTDLDSVQVVPSAAPTIFRTLIDPLEHIGYGYPSGIGAVIVSRVSPSPPTETAIQNDVCLQIKP